MDTSAISYRVADFLKQHPPFQSMEESDLVALAGHGRVRFHEANEYILWQGEPHKLHVFVIQQGTVSLWDETDGRTVLRDVRGAGDMLGIERFTNAPCCLYLARSSSDVVIYAFPASDVEELLHRYLYARQFVEAHDTVTADYQWAEDTRHPQAMFLHDVVGRRALVTCPAQTSIRDAARSMLAAGVEAIAVVDGGAGAQSVVTVDAVLAWVAAGAGDAGQPVDTLARSAPPTVGSDASVADAVLTMAGAEADALVVTADGTSTGTWHALVTARDVAPVFGDQPLSILREIRLAPHPQALRDLVHRARALTLQHLTAAASVGWLARFVSMADVTVVKRIIALTGGDLGATCWCMSGAAGRGESLTRHAPELVLIVEGEREPASQLDQYARVAAMLVECDYLPRRDSSFDQPFHVASKVEWQRRYQQWLEDPVRSEMYLARPLFDLRAIHGDRSLWQGVETTVGGAMDRDFLQIVANDCLASLPPLTFFQDAVVEESGEQTSIFRLQHSALQPLVDVGRVFGMAAGQVLGTSTEQRFAAARALLPEHASIFREASETLRILLWQQARIGIAQGTTGSELPPRLLSRHDRHVLKSGFRSILRLIDFTGNSPWVRTL